MIEDNDDFRTAAQQFPAYTDILDRPTWQDALNTITLLKIKAKENIKNTVLTLTQGRRTSDNGLKNFPNELIAQIAGYSGANKLITAQKAQTMSLTYPFWDKPTCQKPPNQEPLVIVSPTKGLD